jgi:hypothetical protein
LLKSFARRYKGKKSREIMMKKNISLSLVMIALSGNFLVFADDNAAIDHIVINAPLTADNLSSRSAFNTFDSNSGYSSDSSSVNSDYYSPSLKAAFRGNANVSTASKSVVSQAQAIAAQAQNIITDSFAAIDSWITTPAAYTKDDSAILTDDYGRPIDQYGQSALKADSYQIDIAKATIDRNANFKISAVMNQIDIAFANIEKATNGTNTRPIKDAVMRAITAFSTTSTITTEGTMSNKVLAGIVNSAKTVMLAPVKLAVKYAALGTGMAAGAVGGAAAGLGAGINGTAKDVMMTRSRGNLIRINSADSAMTKAAKLIPNTIYKSLKGIVNTAALAAYSAAEGLVLGGAAGYTIGNSVAGDVFSLAAPVNEKVLEIPEIKDTYEQMRDAGVSHAQAVEYLKPAIDAHQSMLEQGASDEQALAAIQTGIKRNQLARSQQEVAARQTQSMREQQSRF